jgi:hypothetical protein
VKSVCLALRFWGEKSKKLSFILNNHTIGSNNDLSRDNEDKEIHS